MRGAGSIRSTWEHVVLSYAWLATGGAAQCWWVSDQLTTGEWPWRPAVIVWCGVFAGYGLLRWSRVRTSTPSTTGPMPAWYAAHGRGLLLRSLGAVAIAAVLLWPAPPTVWWVVLLTVLPWACYLLPIRVGDRHVGLRQVPVLKLLVITWCWVMAVVGLPGAYLAPEHLGWVLFAHGAVQGPLVIGTALLFDLRDRSLDPPALRTVPQLIGPDWTRAVAVALFLYAAAVVVLRGMMSYEARVEGVLPWSELLAGAGLALGVVLALRAGPARSWAFYLVWVDGLFVLVPFLAWLGDRL